MLIDVVKNFEIVMPELMKYLKERHYDPMYFFTKLELSLQYMIIFEFLLVKYNMVMMITPKVMGIRMYIPFDYVVYAEKVLTPITNLNEKYETLIREAFKYIENLPF